MVLQHKKRSLKKNILLPFSYASHYEVHHMLQKTQHILWISWCISAKFNVSWLRKPIIMILYVIYKYMDSIKTRRSRSTDWTPLKRTYLKSNMVWSLVNSSNLIFLCSVHFYNASFTLLSCQIKRELTAWPHFHLTKIHLASSITSGSFR